MVGLIGCDQPRLRRVNAPLNAALSQQYVRRPTIIEIKVNTDHPAPSLKPWVSSTPKPVYSISANALSKRDVGATIQLTLASPPISKISECIMDRHQTPTALIILSLWWLKTM